MAALSNNDERMLNLKQAAKYCGVSIPTFNKGVKPHVTMVPPPGCPRATRGIRFDRVDLDRYLDDYKARYGRPGNKENDLWQTSQGYAKTKPVSMKSISQRKRSTVGEFDKALVLVMKKRQLPSITK